MCGRFTIRSPFRKIIEGFSPLSTVIEEDQFTFRYNIAPSQDVLVIRAAENARELVSLRWGLVPSWADDPSIGNRMINARAETAATKPAFRNAFRCRRCLVVADGFYEWKMEGKDKQPYFIHMRDDSVFAFGGLWERWSREGDVVESCTVLTTTPNDLMRSLHDRMPVIVAPKDYTRWLNSTVQDQIKNLLEPFPARLMEARPVSRTVNSPGNDSPACIESMGADPQEPTLFG